MITTLQASELVTIGQIRPAWFISTMLGANLWETQRDIAISVMQHRYTSVSACHAPGKTFLAAHIVLWFLYNHMPSKVITTAPTARQVYSLLWSEIRAAHSNSKKPLGYEDPLKTRLEIEANWYAEGFATDKFNLERVSGYHSPHILVVVDEASGVEDNILDALESLMSSGDAHMLLIGNPTRADGGFRQSFKSPLYNNFKISAFDTPNFTEFGITRDDMITDNWKNKFTSKDTLSRPYLISPQWVAERFTVWGSNSLLVRTKIDADFPSKDMSNKVCSEEYLDDCRALYYKQDEEYGQIEIGVDVARYGDDETVIAFRAGRQALYEIVLSGRDTMEITGEILTEMRYLGFDRIARVKIDVVGIGSAPVDRLLELQREGVIPEYIQIIGVHAGVSVPKSKLVPDKWKKEKDRFILQRDFLWWQFRTLLIKQEISTKNISFEALHEIAAPTYKVTSKGQIQVESKDDLKKSDRLGKSPDRADAWILCFCDVIPEKRKRSRRVRVSSRRAG